MTLTQFRCCVCIALFMATGSSLEASAALNGFVTGVESSNTFDLGTVRVVLADNAQCSRGTIYGIRVLSGVTAALPSAVYMLRPKAFVGLEQLKETSITCTTAHVVVGLRVRAIGRYNSKGQYIASKLIIYDIQRPQSFGGAAVLEEAAKDGNAGARVSIDGYNMDLGQATSLTLGNSVEYRASLEEDGTLLADRVEVKGPELVTDAHFLGFFSAKNEPQNCASPTAIPAEIQMPDESSIAVLQNSELQGIVSAVGSQLVPEYQKELPANNTSKIHFRFCVVLSSAEFKEGDLITVDGTLPHDDPEWGYDFTHASISHRERDIVALPTGLILVPDKALANLSSKAQLAALLSYAITSILQGDGYAQWSLARSRDTKDKKALFNGCLAINEQVVRIGIRQMFLAGYDIREAPWAWVAAQGKAVKEGGTEGSRTEVKPWFPAYAYDYISRFYSEADFAGLRLGNEEYTKFLNELRRADPDAFRSDQ